jgi:hypothetical protein
MFLALLTQNEVDKRLLQQCLLDTPCLIASDKDTLVGRDRIFSKILENEKFTASECPMRQ